MTAIVTRQPTVAGSPGPVATAVRETTPFAVALIPFGLAVGSAAAAAGLSAWSSLFGAVVLLAGAAQLAAVESLGRGDGVIAVVVVVALINLRFVFYGAGVAEWFAGAPRRRRLALAFPVVDQTFLLCQQRFAVETDLRWRQRYYLTVTVLLAGAFVGSQVVAYHLGAGLPAGVGLHLAAPLAFAGMLAKAMRGRREVVAGVAAAAIVVLGSGWIGASALPVGVICGVVLASAPGSGPSEEPS
jgi:predicted branched-subunit amino acid permease